MYFLKNLACKPDKGELITKDEEKVRQDQAKEKAKVMLSRMCLQQIDVPLCIFLHSATTLLV